jgi:broad specificity phosphatase PhoE
VKTLILARHGESELSLVDVLNGDPAVEVPLTEVGREQAIRLGADVGPVDLVAHTQFRRTRETAELAWPQAPTLVVPELNEISFGRFEGTHWRDGYHDWVARSGPEDECPGGGESRLAAIRRYLTGYRILLERPEDRVALVAHGAQVRYLLLAQAGSPPVAVLEGVPPAQASFLASDQLRHAIGLIEAWAAAPAW